MLSQTQSTYPTPARMTRSVGPPSEGPDWLPKKLFLVNFLANVTVKKFSLSNHFRTLSKRIWLILDYSFFSKRVSADIKLLFF